MIPVQQALDIIRQQTPAAQSCRLPLAEALGRVLAEDVYSDMLLPPFDRASMDGYAFRSADVVTANSVLEVIGEAAAGRRFSGSVGPGQAVRIMTGAPLPAGADCVQKVEETSACGDQVIIRQPVAAGTNVAPAGSEAGPDDKLCAGRFIGPAETAVLASFGAASVPVFRPPRVALLVTGDELVEAAGRPGPDQIRNSNAYSLLAQLRSCRVEPDYLGIAGDDEATLERKLHEALARDIALVTGGVSVGKYDLVAKVLAKLGGRIHFDRVAIKPGKPLTFATAAGRLFFGLPGNPVSSFVTFEVFVRPAIKQMMGSAGGLAKVRASMRRRCLNRGPRDSYTPARTRWTGNRWETELLETRGSADIFRFSEADSLALLPAGSDSPPGTERAVLLLSDYWERIRS